MRVAQAWLDALHLVHIVFWGLTVTLPIWSGLRPSSSAWAAHIQAAANAAATKRDGVCFWKALALYGMVYLHDETQMAVKTMGKCNI